MTQERSQSVERQIAAAVVELLEERGMIFRNGGAAGPEKKLLDMKAAAQCLSRTPSAVRHMEADGAFPERMVKRFGRRIFLTKEGLDRWIETQ